MKNIIEALKAAKGFLDDCYASGSHWTDQDYKCVVCLLNNALEEKPYVWEYRVNGAHTLYSDDKPPEDAYDDGTLIPLYK